MILAIDPGNVTGIAWMGDNGQVTSFELDDGLAGVVWWWNHSKYHQDLTQVYVEDFIIRPDTHRKTREPAAYEIIGYIKGKCIEHDIPCMMIGPSEHTPFSGYKKQRTSKIKRLGWSAPSKDMHADAAASILLLGLMRTHRHLVADDLKEIVND